MKFRREAGAPASVAAKELLGRLQAGQSSCGGRPLQWMKERLWSRLTRAAVTVPAEVHVWVLTSKHHSSLPGCRAALTVVFLPSSRSWGCCDCKQTSGRPLNTWRLSGLTPPCGRGENSTQKMDRGRLLRDGLSL